MFTNVYYELPSDLRKIVNEYRCYKPKYLGELDAINSRVKNSDKRPFEYRPDTTTRVYYNTLNGRMLILEYIYFSYSPLMLGEIKRFKPNQVKSIYF